MRARNVPRIGTAYWATISVASVFGANLGDFAAHVLHLGHARGLPILALAFAAVLIAERRSTRPTTVFYWTALVILRTAATNLGDLATHDLRIAYPLFVAVLAALLAALLRAAQHGVTEGGVPRTDANFWCAMLTAGTLGTALGDEIADGIGLWPATLALCAITAGLLVLRTRPALSGKSGYWASVVGVRTAGTTAGDLLAHGTGLAAGTALSLGAMIAAVLLSQRAATQAASVSPAENREARHPA